jgi:hypothetical protein
MSEIPEFQVAISDFRSFLVAQGHAYEIVWVFRDDLWFRGPDRVLMRYPPPEKNRSLAEKVYDEGRERGLVEITAVATANGHLAATVWFPKFPEEEEMQGWSQGLKLSIRRPLPAAKVIGGLRWRAVRCLSGYRWYQRHEYSIGSRRWAAA